MAKGKNRKKPRRSNARGARGKGSGKLVLRELPELQQARAHWIRHRFPEALRLFDRAVRKDPSNALALVDAARAHGARYEFARAEALLTRLMELGDGRADILQMAGQSYRMIQRPRQAMECLERSLEQAPDLFEARLELAILYERQHRLEEAASQIAEALARQPDSQEARLLSGRIARRRNEVTVAERLLEEVGKRSSAHWVTRAQAWHELGQLYDAAGRYDLAFETVCRAKRIISMHAEATRERSQLESRRLEHLLGLLGADDFARWQGEADVPAGPRRATALLTGMPRSGTTLLERVLDSHPEVATSDEQEAFAKYILPSLFLEKRVDALLEPSDLSRISPEKLAEERERYWRYLSDARGDSIGDRFHIDKNPSTIMLIPGMLRLFPECKLLVAVRDPRDVVVSCFMRYLPLNAVSVDFLTLEGAADRYRRDLEAWLRLREIIGAPWLEVRYEQMVADLEREARRTIDFLGLDWDEAILSYRERLSRRQVNSPTYEDVAKPIYQSAVGRWRNYESHLAPVLERLGPLGEQLGYDA